MSDQDDLIILNHARTALLSVIADLEEVYLNDGSKDGANNAGPCKPRVIQLLLGYCLADAKIGADNLKSIIDYLVAKGEQE